MSLRLHWLSIWAILSATIKRFGFYNDSSFYETCKPHSPVITLYRYQAVYPSIAVHSLLLEFNQMDFPTHFCVCAAYYFLCAAAEGTLLLTLGSYEDLVDASIVPVAVTIVIVYYHLWQSWWFFWTEKIGLLLRPPQLKNPICAPGCVHTLPTHIYVQTTCKVNFASDDPFKKYLETFFGATEAEKTNKHIKISIVWYLIHLFTPIHYIIKNLYFLYSIFYIYSKCLWLLLNECFNIILYPFLIF